ncbi:hypothetical protein SeLEV6574_g01724 [Synchytrium endobioticum]|uniref:Uncharacterized protein n=1 Tax=Synchytrium endobioticum TaxID=286115 RepID=A0A507DBV3_9FUNG|nr:hypothetical protein SeLEV6574_g01724 [Synchytrium endobioticum]
MVPWSHSHHALPQDPGNARKELTREFVACWVAPTQTMSSFSKLRHYVQAHLEGNCHVMIQFTADYELRQVTRNTTNDDLARLRPGVLTVTTLPVATLEGTSVMPTGVCNNEKECMSRVVCCDWALGSVNKAVVDDR